jgi:hypothetical protein
VLKPRGAAPQSATFGSLPITTSVKRNQLLKDYGRPPSEKDWHKGPDQGGVTLVVLFCVPQWSCSAGQETLTLKTINRVWS